MCVIFQTKQKKMFVKRKSFEAYDITRDQNCYFHYENAFPTTTTTTHTHSNFHWPQLSEYLSIMEFTPFGDSDHPKYFPFSFFYCIFSHLKKRRFLSNIRKSWQWMKQFHQLNRYHICLVFVLRLNSDDFLE